MTGRGLPLPIPLRVSSIENDAETMAYMIGFLMTFFPYAQIAMSLTSRAARDHFAGRAGRQATDLHKLVAEAERSAARKPR